MQANITYCLFKGNSAPTSDGGVGAYDDSRVSHCTPAAATLNTAHQMACIARCCGQQSTSSDAAHAAALNQQQHRMRLQMISVVSNGLRIPYGCSADADVDHKLQLC
jgi:hypothetical protein